MDETFEIFLTAPPGLEPVLCHEVAEAGFTAPQTVPGGVVIQGGWRDVWRANLDLRGAGRVLARFASFPVFHLAQLDKRARKIPWATLVPPEMPVSVEVTTRKSKVYHAGAARQRIERAIADALGPPDTEGQDGIKIMVRIDDNRATFSIDTSGEPLHKRGAKSFVGKAPMRETLAALFLRQCGYNGREPVLDPMCGSGTFLLEAAAMAAGHQPGAGRAFAYEQLASFDPEVEALLRRSAPAGATDARFYGFDRDDGAIRGATANLERAGLTALCQFARSPVSDLARPDGPTGLVIVNPPYGARIGNRKLLFGLYGALGQVLKSRFAGWRVGIVTSDGGLARATELPFLKPGPPVPHGSLKIRLYQTDPLG